MKNAECTYCFGQDLSYYDPYFEKILLTDCPVCKPRTKRISIEIAKRALKDAIEAIEKVTRLEAKIKKLEEKK